MYIFEDIECKRFFANGRTDLHIKNVPQSFSTDNPTGFRH